MVLSCMGQMELVDLVAVQITKRMVSATRSLLAVSDKDVNLRSYPLQNYGPLGDKQRFS